MSSRRADGDEVRIGLTLCGPLVALAEVQAVDPFTVLAEAPPPGRAEQHQVLLVVLQPEVLDALLLFLGGEDVVDVALVLLRRVDREELDLVVVPQAGPCLQDHIRRHGRTEVLLTDGLEELAEIEAPCLKEHRGAVIEAARPFVQDLDTREIHAQATDRRRAAAGHIELQQGSLATAEFGAPTTRRELGSDHRVRREDGVASAVHDIVLLAQRLLEVDDLLERESVDEDQVVLRAVAAHGEAGELAVRHHAGQPHQGPHHIAAAAGGVAQLITGDVPVRRAAVRVGAQRAGDDDHLLQRGRDRPEFETHEPDPAFDHPDSRFDAGNITVHDGPDFVEAVRETSE